MVKGPWGTVPASSTTHPTTLPAAFGRQAKACVRHSHRLVGAQGLEVGGEWSTRRGGPIRVKSRRIILWTRCSPPVPAVGQDRRRPKRPRSPRRRRRDAKPALRARMGSVAGTIWCTTAWTAGAPGRGAGHRRRLGLGQVGLSPIRACAAGRGRGVCLGGMCIMDPNRAAGAGGALGGDVQSGALSRPHVPRTSPRH